MKRNLSGMINNLGFSKKTDEIGNIASINGNKITLRLIYGYKEFDKDEIDILCFDESDGGFYGRSFKSVRCNR